MSDSLPQRNGGQILVEALRRNAVDTVYCIPGESYLPVLDALHDADGIRSIVKMCIRDRGMHRCQGQHGDGDRRASHVDGRAQRDRYRIGRCV